jgi:predicted transposase YbfD/YdcC
MPALSPAPSLRLLLDHFAAIRDWRQPCKVMYPLHEVLLLVVCGTIACGDDYDDIVDWGEAHLQLLRRFCEFHFGIPCADWLRVVMNRIDPGLFADCFTAWVAATVPGKIDLVAIDGKTSRRSHDRAASKLPLHLVSAFASHGHLVLGQQAVDEKANEIIAIPELIARIKVEGALVSVDAIGCNPRVADAIIAAKADYLLAVKDNQPTLAADCQSYFETAPAAELQTHATLEKNHGRIETRTYTISHAASWLTSGRSYPGAPRFPDLASAAMVERTVEWRSDISRERSYYISSRALTPETFADAVRSHWAIENNLHWVLDVTFREDLSRLRHGHGAHNMAIVRHFAFNCLKQVKDKRSMKTRRKRASYDPAYMLSIIPPTSR